MKKLLFGSPVMFNSPDPAGSGGGETTPPVTPPAAPPPATQTAGEAPKSFTQEQLDAIIQDRLSRAGTAKQKEILDSLGVTDPEEAKKLIADAKKAATDKLTSDEKAALTLKAANDKAINAESAAAATLKTANDRLLLADVKLAASAAGFRPEAIDDVFLVIDRSTITEKDGKFVGLKEAIEAVATAKPFWLTDATVAAKKSAPTGTPPLKPVPTKKPEGEEKSPHKFSFNP